LKKINSISEGCYLVIRADATKEMGTGHIMRCIALAQAWQDMGGTVVFVSDCRSEFIKQRIIEECFELVKIEQPYPHPGDIETLLNCVSNVNEKKDILSQTWVILDGYHFDAAYQKSIQEAGYRLMVIDDYVHLDHYYADIILNQNISAIDYTYHFDNNAIKLLGADYAMLRREFIQYKNQIHGTSKDIKKILVTLGGADPDNITVKVIRALKRLNDSALNAKVIVGPANPNLDELNKEVADVFFKCEIVYAVSDMPGLMAWADLAISAAGSTCWELCYMGVPSLVVVAAENQRKIAFELDKCGAAISLGWHETLTDEKIYLKIKEVISYSDVLKETAKKCRSIINGNGVHKIISKLLNNNQPRKSYKITIVSDKKSWINDYISEFINTLVLEGNQVNWIHDINGFSSGDFAFFLGCEKLVSENILEKNKHNIVVHESDLPKGRGWSPLTWQVLEGKNQIPITLFEAEGEVDAGPIYLQKMIYLDGTELVEDLRQKQAQKTIELCLEFIHYYPNILKNQKKQIGISTYYRRRTPSDSKLDPDKTIKDQFNLLRVSDNNRYPAFFDLNGCRYYLIIEKTII